MKQYLIVETRDPSDSRDHDWMVRLAGDLKQAGAPATIFLAENGVFAARNGAAAEAVQAALKAGCTILADRYALRERGIRDADIAKGVKTAELDVVLDALEAGVSVMWR
jgi:hypothetical protein